MILYLEHALGLEPHNLLAKPDKCGPGSARAPLVRPEPSGTPLAALQAGEKLHIAASGDQHGLSGRTPEQFVQLLLQLGLTPTVRLMQIHLVANQSGSGGSASFAFRLSVALWEAKLEVDEIKAPLGDVRCDAYGKLWVKLPDSSDWQPSSPALNYYCGPRVQDKHKR